MSGIAGILNLDGVPVTARSLTSMTERMSHRGPDSITHYFDKNIGLGQCSLHTTPESALTVFPFNCPKTNCIVVMDGWLSNIDILKSVLRQKKFQGPLKGDASVVAASYHTWGHGCFERLDGEFAIAIWDPVQQSLVCARDAMSKKPFHYHYNGKNFSFASEINSLSSLPGVPFDLNFGFIAERLINECYTLDETPWRDILRLPQSHFLHVGQHGLSKAQYWSPDLSKKIHYKRSDDYVEHYRELLLRTVKNYSRSIRPLSCEVSGGLDSSAVFAAAYQNSLSPSSSEQEILGFSLDFKGYQDADEIRYVESVGDFLNKNIEFVQPSKLSLKEIEEFVREHKIFTPGPTGFMHSGIYNAASKANSRVLLTGFGGDEWLSGRVNAYAEYIQIFDWNGLQNYFSGELKHHGVGKTLTLFIRHGLLPLAPNRLKRVIRPFRSISSNIQRPDFLDISIHEKLEERKKSYEANQMYFPRQKGHMHTWGNPHIRLANETMEHLASLHGVELRSPLDSKKMLEFSLAIPEGNKNNKGINRAIHRNALRGLLPEMVINREDKADFSIMYDRYVQDLKDNSPWKKRLQNRALVNHKIKEYTDSQTDRYLPWHLYESSLFF